MLALIRRLFAKRNTLFISAGFTFSNPFITRSSNIGRSSVSVKTHGGYSESGFNSGSGPSFNRFTGTTFDKSKTSATAAGAAGPPLPFPPAPPFCNNLTEDLNGPLDDVNNLFTCINFKAEGNRQVEFTKKPIHFFFHYEVILNMNQTDPLAASIRGSNPQNLIEKILRGRIYENRYWKEHCFGLTAETILDKAVKLDGIGGIYSHNTKPTPFICLVLKLLQIQPERDIIEEYLKQEDFKYLRALAAFYIRLTFRARDVYELLEPLLIDYRKLCVRTLSASSGAGGWKVTHMDEFLDELLTSEMSCDVILPHLAKRDTLVTTGALGPRLSALDDELNEDDTEEDNEQELDEKEIEQSNSNEGRSQKSSSTNTLDSMLKKAQVRHRDDSDNNTNEEGLGRETKQRRLDIIDDSQQESHSVQEANALRAKLGLKPLRL